VHVVYGLLGLKVHSKVTLVVRREGNTIRRYLHLATGNYNPMTARLYTDIGLFTCDPEIAADATAVFNYLTGYSDKNQFCKLLVAPINLRQRLAELIRREIEHQRRGQHGRLILKMNALEDPGIIRLLYEASRAGVEVDLLVRGICCLRPGVAGLSDHIRVTSIVGRFLEHSRIFYFRNGGAEEIYLGSADLMPRNLNRRVEVLFPVSSPRLVARLRDEILATYLADEACARYMRSDGSYTPKSRDGRLESQARFLAQCTPRSGATENTYAAPTVTSTEAAMQPQELLPFTCVAMESANAVKPVCILTAERKQPALVAAEVGRDATINAPATVVSGLANDLARCFLSVVEDIRGQLIHESQGLNPSASRL
jgi:polyphosphate kinase